jgi:NDP-sugar pyrophosphorylase family protein
MEAIVMAAGRGTRLRPLTDHWPKPVLPIDGRPVLGTLLHELRGAGCERVTIVTGHLAEAVESLVGDGAGFGLPVSYVRQPEVHGSADAVRRALAGGARTPAIVAAADTVYDRGAVARFAEAWGDAPGALAARRGQPASGDKPGIGVAGGRVTAVVDDSRELTSVPLWGLGAEVAALLPDLPGPPYELSTAFQRAVDAGLEVRAVVVGGTRDLTHPVDLIRENFLYLRDV